MTLREEFRDDIEGSLGMTLGEEFREGDDIGELSLGMTHWGSSLGMRE